MDYGRTNQQGIEFFTDYMGNNDPNSNPDLDDSLNSSIYRESSPQALGNTALYAGNSVPTGIHSSESAPSVSTSSYPMPPQLGQIAPQLGQIIATSDSSHPVEPTTYDPSKPSFLDEHGDVIVSEINSAANDPSSFYETMLNGRVKANGGDK